MTAPRLWFRRLPPSRKIPEESSGSGRSLMNAYYVLALMVGRVFGVLTIVSLSYILDSRDFGIFIVIITNALLMHILASSWISNSFGRDISSLSGKDQEIRISHSLGYAALLSLFPLSAAAILLAIDVDKFQYVALTLIVWAVTLFYELVLVINNARGLSRDYSVISFFRGLLTSGLSISLAYWGFGVWGAVGGQIAGTMLTIISRKSFWLLWGLIEFRHLPRNGIGAQLKFGLISAFALNLYLMAAALCRNFVLFWLGEAEAGYFSLSADIFFAPIALFTSALSLSNIRELYRSAGNEAAALQASDFLAGALAFCIPYALSGVFLGPSLASLFLSADMSAQVSRIAPHSIIQAACFCVLSTQTTIAMTQGRLTIAIGLPLVTLGLVASALLVASFTFGDGGDTLLRYAEAVTAAIVAITMLVLLVSRPLLKVSIIRGECLRILAASTAMCLVLAALAKWPLPFAPLSAIALGGATFVGAAWLLGSRIVRNLLRVSGA